MDRCCSAWMSATAIFLAMLSVGTAPEARSGFSETSLRPVMCGGEPATIVGRNRQFRLNGTAGADVIVTNGAKNVAARGGNDLVCVTRGSLTSVTLGAGVDRVIGGSGRDLVQDLGRRDVARTAGGGDFVRLATAARNGTVRFVGRVDLGPGDDFLVPGIARIVNTSSAPQGRAGTDTFVVEADEEAGPAVVNNRTGRSTYAGRPTAIWDSFETFLVALGTVGEATLRFTGSSSDETVTIDAESIGALDLRMGGGVDTVRTNQPASSSVIRGGGQVGDRLSYFGARQLELNLATGESTSSPQLLGPAVSSRVDGFNRLEITAISADITGSSVGEKVRVRSCGGTILGGAGEDELSLIDTASSPDSANDCLTVTNSTNTLDGGAGNDSLTGSDEDDSLVGGPGSDTADGRAGTDTCEAESTARCEN